MRGDTFLKYLAAIRIWEALLMTGFSFIGILFSPAIDFSILPLVVFVVTVYVFSVYALNSVADYQHDKLSDRLSTVSAVSRRTYLILLVVGVGSFSIFSFLINVRLLAICLTAFSGWILYYLPPFRFKSTFLLGTLIHFFCGILHFHMGYASFEAPTSRSILISGIFALLLGIGHVNHEIIDSNEDQKAGLRTTAVRIGLTWSSNIRTILSCVLVFYIILLSYFNVLSFRDTAIFLPSTILILATSMTQIGRPFLFQKVSRISIATSCFILLIVRLANGILIGG